MGKKIDRFKKHMASFKDKVGKMNERLRKMSVVRFLSLGYLITITLGTILLMLPFATKAGAKVEISNVGDWFNLLINTLLTATSATCVTGLISFDTFDHWTLFGQIVIIILIQIGGLGFMTIITLIFQIFRRKINLFDRTVLMQSAGSYNISGVIKLIRTILIGTFIFEFLGAILLFLRFKFGYDFSNSKAIYYGIFHSISAFCNAGFDLFGSFSSLTNYVNDPAINFIIASLIMIGGLGFIIWQNIIESHFRWKNFELHTKIVLVFNGILFLVSGLFYLLFEYHSPSMEGLSFFEKLLASFFMGVTPRTAGFNSIDLSLLTPSSKLFTVILMFIGGCPGSTAGGIKVTTIIIILANLFSQARGREHIIMFKRRISSKLVKQASALFIAYLIVTLLSTILICSVEAGFNTTVAFEDVLFEVVSGVGTVGLGMLKVASLTMFTRILLIFLMYIGRIGAFTLFAIFFKEENDSVVMIPEGNVLVG